MAERKSPFEKEILGLLEEIYESDEYRSETNKFFEGMDGHFKKCQEKCGEDEACMKPCAGEFLN
jgi:hypothetical protein